MCRSPKGGDGGASAELAMSVGTDSVDNHDGGIGNA